MGHITDKLLPINLHASRGERNFPWGREREGREYYYWKTVAKYIFIYIYICVYECGVSEQKIRFVAIDRAALIAFILPRDNEKRGQLAYFVDATGSSLL